MTKCLVAGANGATGRLVVEQLLERGCRVKAVVRSAAKLPTQLAQHPQLSVIEAGICDASDVQLAEFVRGCDAIVSCLGHNLTLKGVFGHPRRLVTESVRRLCESVKASGALRPVRPVRFVLMNTAGHSNRDLAEPVSLGQRLVISLLRLTVPPHADNEQAADYLRTEIGQSDSRLEWCAVRPDSLTDESAVSDYSVYESPIRSAIFNSGRTSRINVAHLMADLVTDDDVWERWKGRMPVIYND